MTHDDELIREIIKHKEASISFFGERGKPERERQIFCAFIRCLGLSFSPAEIKSMPPTEQFPDVEFRGTKFEIKEMLDGGRKRQDEYGKSVKRLKKKKIESSDDLIEIHDYDPQFLTFEEVGQKVGQFFNEQCVGYGQNERASTNLLIYFNLQDVMLDKQQKRVAITLDRMNWRSVSVVGGSWCYVFAGSNDAPDFITEAIGSFHAASGLWEKSAP